MKRIIILIVLLFFAITLFGNSIILNKDKPSKGKWTFKPKKVWEIDSAGDTILVKTAKIVVSNNGTIFVAEQKAQKLLVFNSEGKFLRAIGKQGEGPGEYKTLSTFYIIDNNVIVPDMSRFHYFKTNGKYIKTINPGISFLFPNAMIDKYSFLYTKSEKNDKFETEMLKVFNLKNKKSTLIKKIVSKKPNVVSSGKLTIMVKFDGTVVEYNNGFFYLGNKNKYIITKIDMKGKKLFEFGIKSRKKIKLTEKMKRARYDRVVLNGGKMPKTLVDRLIKNDPDLVSYFNNITLVGNFIYVYVKDPRNNKVQKIDIFTNKGKYIYRAEFKLPEDLILQRGPVFKDKFAYVFAEDEDGERKLIKYSINLPK